MTNDTRDLRENFSPTVERCFPAPLVNREGTQYRFRLRQKGGRFVFFCRRADAVAFSLTVYGVEPRFVERRIGVRVYA
jgi:hypothetical protein